MDEDVATGRHVTQLQPLTQSCVAGRVLAGAVAQPQRVHTDLPSLTRHVITVAVVDECVGRVLNQIETLGLLNNSIVIFVSDHGDVLGEHGIFNKTATFYESEVKVPFFVRMPGSTGEHKTVNGLTSSVDFVPTLFDLLEMSPDVSLPGHSLKPMMDGEASQRDHVLSSTCHSMMIRTANSKLWVDSRAGDGELYDLETDPNEYHNLFQKSEYAELRNQLTERMLLERIRSDIKNSQPTRAEINLHMEVGATRQPEMGMGRRRPPSMPSDSTRQGSR